MTKLKVRMHTLGKKQPGPAIAKDVGAKSITYPDITINTEQIEEVDGMIPGTKLQVVFDCEVKEAGLGLDQWSDDKKKGYHVRLSLTKGAIVEKKPNRNYGEAAGAAYKEGEGT